MCGIIKGVVDIVTSPIDSAVKLAKGDIAGAFLEPFEAAFDADLFFGADFGDMMSLMDDVLDEVPGLKEAIVIAAGVATGGVGAIVAAAAIAATDTLSEVNEGNFELNDLAAGGLEFASLAAAGATAGAAGALTTTAKTQIASRVLASSGLLGEDASRFVQIAGGAVGGDWSSVTESIRNSAIALQQTGLLGEDVNNVLGAVAAASTGDYTSLQSGVTAGIGAAQKVAGDEASPFLAGLSTAINGDYGSAETIASTLIETTDRTGLLGSDSPYLEAGRVALGSDWSSAGSAGESLLQVADASDVIPGAGGRLLDAGQVALDSNWESVDGAIGAAVDVVDETDVLGAGVGQVIEVAD
ncbi:MAG: hypothetical protein AAF264_05440, partial [Pseudomonadota bacterium]